MIKKSEPIENLPNIGVVLAKELENVGITTFSDLQKIGSAGALFKIRGESGRGCINMLYALEGAIKQVRWHYLTPQEKEEAKKAFQKFLNI